MSAGSGPARVIVDKTTVMSIGLFVTLAGVLIGGAFWVADVHHQLDSIVRELQAIRGTIDGNWSRADMRLWVHTFRQLNPDIPVPPLE